MKATLEVVILPVSDPDKSLDFYRDKLAFPLDVDYFPTQDFRVVQLTPPGSSTSIQFGVGLTDAPPGSVQGLYLVVTMSPQSVTNSSIEASASAPSGTKTSTAGSGWVVTASAPIRTEPITQLRGLQRSRRQHLDNPGTWPRECITAHRSWCST